MTFTNEITEMALLTPPVRARKAEPRRSTKSGLLQALTPSGERRPERRTRTERRATPRVRVEVECEERHGNSRYYRITEDLSPFGLSTRQGLTRSVGSRVRLALYLPDDRELPVLVEAEVVGQLNAEGGMRLAFRKPSVQAVRRIHRFLAEHLRAAPGA
jgi:hypothetical protein